MYMNMMSIKHKADASFYPDMRRVAFISDNTYGGLSMQAWLKRR